MLRLSDFLLILVNNELWHNEDLPLPLAMDKHFVRAVKEWRGGRFESFRQEVEVGWGVDREEVGGGQTEIFTLFPTIMSILHLRVDPEPKLDRS